MRIAKPIADELSSYLAKKSKQIQAERHAREGGGGEGGRDVVGLIFHERLPRASPRLQGTQNVESAREFTIGSCFSVHYRVMEHVGSLESTKEA